MLLAAKSRGGSVDSPRVSKNQSRYASSKSKHSTILTFHNPAASFCDSSIAPGMYVTMVQITRFIHTAHLLRQDFDRDLVISVLAATSAGSGLILTAAVVKAFAIQRATRSSILQTISLRGPSRVRTIASLLASRLCRMLLLRGCLLDRAFATTTAEQ